MFTKATIISALAGLAAAAPAPRSTDSNVFQIVALHSTSPIQGAGIQANGFSFFTGKATSANCPAGVENLDCSKFGNQTVLGSSGSSLGLSTTVPGGQQVFVRSDGSLGYTTPHSAVIPDGAALEPFEYTPEATDGSVGTLKFQDSSFNACPTGETNGAADVYQIFAAAVSPDTQVGCISITVGTATSDVKYASYQY